MLGIAMSERTIYLDCAATTAPAGPVREAMARFVESEWGNPSSRHRLGVRAAAAVDEARSIVARCTGVAEEGVIFTSGGTEANNLAVLGAARARRAAGARSEPRAGDGERAGSGAPHVLIGPSEHPSVRDAALALADEGFEVEVGRHAPDGSLDVADFTERMRSDTVLVALMLACNEHGGTYPVRSVAAAARARSPRAHMHTDAVQAFGKLELDVRELGVDSASLSAHKFHGPKGSGALLLAREAILRPLVFGGGQERGLRSGTENPAGIVGLARAVALADDARERTFEHLLGLRRAFADALAGSDLRLLSPGGEDAVLPSIALVLCGAPGAPPAEVYLHHLEERGVLVSAGSACHSKKKDASPALLAIGLSGAEVQSVLRFSFSRDTTEAEVLEGVRVLLEVDAELRVGRR